MNFRKDFSLEGTIKGLYLGVTPDSLVTTSANYIQAEIGGMNHQGGKDRHYGTEKISGVREKNLYDSSRIRNNRQWSAVSTEELSHIAQQMDVPELKPEWLGANILLEGIPRLTSLPPLTYLVIPSVQPKHPKAVLVVYEENLPCKAPGEVIERRYGGKGRFFPKASLGYRGLVGWVEQPGRIHEGDKATILFPSFISDEQLKPFK